MTGRDGQLFWTPRRQRVRSQIAQIAADRTASFWAMDRRTQVLAIAVMLGSENPDSAEAEEIEWLIDNPALINEANNLLIEHGRSRSGDAGRTGR
jgi:hypothetical protein